MKRQVVTGSTYTRRAVVETCGDICTATRRLAKLADALLRIEIDVQRLFIVNERREGEHHVHSGVLAGSGDKLRQERRRKDRINSGHQKRRATQVLTQHRETLV